MNFLILPEARQTINYDKIKVYGCGNTGVINCLLTVKRLDKDGKDYTNHCRNTVTWIRQQDHWQLAAIHFNRIRD